LITVIVVCPYCNGRHTIEVDTPIVVNYDMPKDNETKEKKEVT